MKNETRFCLLVEDDPDDQAFFIDALQSISSYTACYAVSNGEQALAALIDQGIDPDYIFTDLRMPRMDGLELLKTVKRIRKFAHIPVIVYSSDYSDELANEVKKLGAVAFYQKSKYAALKDILRKYFREPYYGPTIL